MCFETLDHNLLLAEQIVDQKPGAPAIGLHHHHNPGVGVVDAGHAAEHTPQPDQRRVFLAKLEYFFAARQTADLFRRKRQGLGDTGERQDISLRPDPYTQSVKDRQCQRQPYGEVRAEPSLRAHIDIPAKGIDVAAHHIQSNPASGQIAHTVGSGKPGKKDQLGDLLRRKFCIGRNQPTRKRPLQYLVLVQPAAVIFNFDDHMAAALTGADPNAGGLGLAGGAPFRRCFDAVIQAVANHVQKRVADALDHGFIQFRGFAAELQLHLFAELLADIAHQTRQAVKDKSDG